MFEMGRDDIDRTPSGIEGLDEIIGGGFPRGSLIILAGNPGVGKTIFSASFLYRGIVDYGERGVYVSFAENREAFFSNMRAFGFNFEELEKVGKFRFLDLITAREEAAPAIMETILREVSEVGARRLVIDSFSALAQMFKETHEVRIILHTILSRVTRLLGCTTLLIVENPYGENRIGFGIEEFVADGIILLRRSRLADRLLRELEVFKMRGTPTYETQAVFTLKGGFKVFPPFKPKPIEKPSRFQPQPDTELFFSSGSPDLDKMLGGGYPRGSMVLIEIDEQITTLQYHLIAVPVAWNFIAHGRGVFVVPSAGVDQSLVLRRAWEGGFTKDEINSLLRIRVKDYPGIKSEPYLVAFRGENFSEDYMRYMEVERDLRERTGQPTLSVIGVDTLINIYGVKETISALRFCATRVREVGDLDIVLLKPGYPRVTKILSAIADIHLRITREHGSVLVYGIKPRTNLYVLEMDVSRGYAMPKLTPII
ncbi:MAG: ATPase domain-containing protein [Candidatus Bathyarchaeia archaeon]|nr:AAA family ATPase [Candidatus Bathyarchaeota archaeon]